MSEPKRRRHHRSWAGSRLDEITLAAATALLIVAVAAVVALGPSAAGDRLGCGLNDIVNRLLAYPRPCR